MVSSFQRQNVPEPQTSSHNVNPEELVLKISYSRKYDGEKSIVVVVKGTSKGWPSDSNMLAVEGTASLGNISSFVEIMCKGPPFCSGP